MVSTTIFPAKKIKVTETKEEGVNEAGRCKLSS